MTPSSNISSNASVASLTDELTGMCKVNRVCRLVRDAIEEVDASGLRLSVITSYVRQQPSNPEQALREVMALGSLSALQDGDSTANFEAESALSYLLLLVKVDVLFDVALGMYDLDVVRGCCVTVHRRHAYKRATVCAYFRLLLSPNALSAIPRSTCLS